MKKEQKNKEKKKATKVARFSVGIVGSIVLGLFVVFGNKYVFDLLIALVAFMATYEYNKCISKEAKPIGWVGYFLSISIAFLHVLPMQVYMIATVIGLPTIMLILFLHIILTNMKINFKDAVFSLMGSLYVYVFTVFIAALYGYNGNSNGEQLNAMLNGKYLVWYLFFAAWGTDVPAYIFGMLYGKHHFSKVSPKKSIEGCIAGTVGSVLFALGYTAVIQAMGANTYSFLTIAIVTAILSIISQIGDFAASTIKRYFDEKDFSELIPGHGGILDRIDSLMFVAPYAYLVFTMILNNIK